MPATPQYMRVSKCLISSCAMQKKSGCVAEYFAFRWISLLVSREFPLPDVIAVWDTLLAEPCRFNFLLYLCVAMTMYAIFWARLGLKYIY